MGPVCKIYGILRNLGPRIVCLRASVYLGRALGIPKKRFPNTPWNSIDLGTICRTGTPIGVEEYAAYKSESPKPFLFPLGKPPRIDALPHSATNRRQPDLAKRLEFLRQDRCIYFFSQPSPEPINWYHNPFDDKRSTPGKPWYEISDYLPSQGDPRMLWEPSRAAWAIDCVRAKVRGMDDDCGPLLWRWIDSWMSACSPFTGFQWKCGQESSVRFIAIALALWGLARDEATTPARWTQFARLAWATGRRIINQINYAVSQKNNHAISEACGLMLIGHLFPEFRESEEWFRKGRRVLLEEVRRQVYPDGSYLQQSMNYERVMLDGSILGARIAELADDPMPPEYRRTMGRCADFLFEMMDEHTGQLPQYGPNDGAHVLPLTECDFTDFRPVIQAAHYLANNRRLLDHGTWDEQLVWLFGENAPEARLETAASPTSRSFESGGYYTLRNKTSWAMVRCHSYQDRPTQCDPLQLDLWWRGHNIFQDCGTYHYYCPGRKDLEYYFKSIAAHNTIEIDGDDPLELVSRFLWLPWPKASKVRHEHLADGVACFEGVSYAYARKPWRVTHRRLVFGVPGDTWIIIDELNGRGEHRALLRWHMADYPYAVITNDQTVRLDTPHGPLRVLVTSDYAELDRFEVIRARNEPGRVQGLASPYYGDLVATPTLEAEATIGSHARFFTIVQPESPSAATASGIQADGGADSQAEHPHGTPYRHDADAIGHDVNVPTPDRYEKWAIDTAAGKLTFSLRPAIATASILEGCAFVANGVNL